MKTSILRLGLIAAAMGCGSPTESGGQRSLGFLVGVHPGDPHITMADTVSVGEAFTATVRTYGLDGCWEEDGTEVAIEGLDATVRPFDIDRSHELEGCYQAIQNFDHTATLRFDRTGAARVTFHGRTMDDRNLVTFTRAVVVQ